MSLHPQPLSRRLACLRHHADYSAVQLPIDLRQPLRTLQHLEARLRQPPRHVQFVAAPTSDHRGSEISTAHATTPAPPTHRVRTSCGLHHYCRRLRSRALALVKSRVVRSLSSQESYNSTDRLLRLGVKQFNCVDFAMHHTVDQPPVAGCTGDDSRTAYSSRAHELWSTPLLPAPA